MARILQDVGTTSLHIASREGHDAVVRTLLASGAAVNQTRTVSGCSVQLSVDAETNWVVLRRCMLAIAHNGFEFRLYCVFVAFH